LWLEEECAGVVVEAWITVFEEGVESVSAAV
jgi:hypothetical protein